MRQSNEKLDTSYKEKTSISSPHRPLNSSTHNPLSHNPLTHKSSSHSPINPSSHQPINSSTHQPINSLTLITGGAGFLGSHLCDRLIEEGHFVICMDNLLTGSKKNIEHLLNHDHFIFINHDVTKHIDLEALLSEAEDSSHITHHSSGHNSMNSSTQNPSTHSPSTRNSSTHQLDNILHFASPASPKDYQEHPIHTLKVGALGTYNTLGLAKATGAKYLLASSSEVYGDPQVNPQPEDYWGHVNPVGPRSVYDEAKRYAEAITMAYHNKHGIDIRIARIFNTYGPRMRIDDGRALPNFMMQALQNKPLTVYGDGSQTRSFCYVDDLVEGIYRLLIWEPSSPHNSLTHQPINSSPNIQDLRPNTQDLTPVFNLGNPDEISILDFAKEVIEVTDSESDITFKPLPTNDPQVRRPDISKAQKQLGWKPKISRKEGLKKVFGYFRSAVARE